MTNLSANSIHPTFAIRTKKLGVESDVSGTIYRSYFTAGIAVILTLGASWGAYLLWRIGFAGNFTSISIHDVNAHGHAQIFGWVGLFIMGVAYQAFSRFWHTTLAAPRLAMAVLGIMLVGIIVRTCGMTLSEYGAIAVHAAMLGAALEIASVCIFAAQIGATFVRSNRHFEPYTLFIFAAVGWFVIQACFSAWHTWNTMTATSHESLLWYIATYQAPLRDMQIHGLAMFMIFGMSMRLFPAFFQLPKVSSRRALTAFGVLLFAVMGESIIFIVYRFTQNHAVAALLMLPWLMLAAGSWLIAGPWKLWRPLPVADRSGKFIRAAYGWLAVSLVMLLAMPIYQAMTGIAFSHAYYGAIRHAITVGFISMMIMGIAAKMVPTLNGVDTRSLSRLWGPFVLINLGCFLRVSTQILTDLYDTFFAVIGVSGMLEVTALAWWGMGLIGLMRSARRKQTRLAWPG